MQLDLDCLALPQRLELILDVPEFGLHRLFVRFLFSLHLEYDIENQCRALILPSLNHASVFPSRRASTSTSPSISFFVAVRQLRSAIIEGGPADAATRGQ